jgi:hypothetical protein
MAFFSAASDNAFHISRKHVASALATQLPLAGQAVDGRTLQRPSADETIAKRKRPIEISSGPTKTAPKTDSAPHIEESPNKNQGADRPSGVQKLGETIWAHTKPIPAKDEKVFQIPPGGYKLAESIWQRRADEMAVEEPVHVRGGSKVGRRTIVAGIAIAIAAAAIITAVMPSMLASAGFYSAAGLNNQPAPVQASRAVEPTPALPKAANDAEKFPTAAPAQNRAENTSSAVGEVANSGVDRTSDLKAAEKRTATRRPLSAEEEAAVARGIQEMEKERLQGSQFSPR